VESVLYEEQGPIAIITFNREEKLNAMNTEVVSKLIEYLHRVNDSDHIRMAILTGKGRAFVAGADIAEYSEQTAVEFNEYQRRSREMFDGIEKNKKIIIAAVNGYALGGGFELVLSCDLVIACSGVKMGLPEIHLGLLPGGGGTQRLSRLIGRNRAKYYILSGRRMTAEEAEQYGIVHTVCSPEQLMETAMSMAEEISAKAPIAVQEGKRLINEGLEASLDTAISYEGMILANLYQTADANEGIRAFIEKRTPIFRNR
jgi:enoyl-CoA hydratase